jgi:hypothetical protein
MTVRYVGSGPYCYANSLAMMLGSAAHGAAVIKVLPNSSKPAWNLGCTATDCCVGWRRRMNSYEPACRAAEASRPEGLAGRYTRVPSAW